MVVKIFLLEQWTLKNSKEDIPCAPDKLLNKLFPHVPHISIEVIVKKADVLFKQN